MKRIKWFYLLLMVFFTLVACRRDEESTVTPAPEEAAPTEEVAQVVEPEETPTEEGEVEPDDTSAPVEELPTAAPVRIVVISHGLVSDPFWSVVKNGVDQAAADLGVLVEYQSLQSFDMVAMSRLIDATVASEPDGLVVTIPDANALGNSIRAAVDAGIPVVSMNTGRDAAERIGVNAHVGQSEYEAGFSGGERMAAAGVTAALCVNQELGNAALDQRCQGFAAGMARQGASVDLLAISISDPAGSRQRIKAALAANPNLNGILTLGPAGAALALEALEEEGLVGQIQLATFDLSPEVLEAIRDGNMLFAIDQQQYLQGYLPVFLLAQFRENIGDIANFVVTTGPGFITQENVANYIILNAAGIR